jgi:hypothetical protein
MSAYTASGKPEGALRWLLNPGLLVEPVCQSFSIVVCYFRLDNEQVGWNQSITSLDHVPLMESSVACDTRI